AANIHRAAVNVAGDPGPRAVGREGELVRGVRAVHDDPIPASAAVDGVTAVAGRPQEVVEALAAGQDVVPGAAVHGQLDQAPGKVRSVQYVVTAEGVDQQPVVRRHRIGDAHDGDRAHCGVDGSRSDGPDLADVGAVGAIDDNDVGLAVDP